VGGEDCGGAEGYWRGAAGLESGNPGLKPNSATSFTRR